MPGKPGSIRSAACRTFRVSPERACDDEANGQAETERGRFGVGARCGPRKRHDETWPSIPFPGGTRAARSAAAAASLILEGEPSTKMYFAEDPYGDKGA